MEELAKTLNTALKVIFKGFKWLFILSVLCGVVGGSYVLWEEVGSDYFEPDAYYKISKDGKVFTTYFGNDLRYEIYKEGDEYIPKLFFYGSYDSYPKDEVITINGKRLLVSGNHRQLTQEGDGYLCELIKEGSTITIIDSYGRKEVLDSKDFKSALNAGRKVFIQEVI